MNIEKLYNDFGIFTCPESNKHYREGWINVPCPFCTGNPGYHLGYNTNGNYFACFRCGGHPEIKTLMNVLNVPYSEVQKILYEYKGKFYIKPPVIKIRKKAFKIPSMVKEINELPKHMKYLKQRGFNPDYLVNKYGIKGWGPYGLLDDINYSFRIFIPVFWEGVVVSWQTRDITDKSPLKYLSCPLKRELVPHKEILYQVPVSDYVVLTEGVFDVWKIEMAGYLGTCCFGIEYSINQLKLLKNYKKTIIFFDSEKQAQNKAKEIKSRLEFMGKEVINTVPPVGEDPGSLTVKEIKEMLK